MRPTCIVKPQNSYPFHCIIISFQKVVSGIKVICLFVLLQETISDNCVVIFSKTSCSYCTMAKKLFQDMNVNYKVVELDMLEYGSQFQDALYKMTGERTVSLFSVGFSCQAGGDPGRGHPGVRKRGSNLL